MNYKFEVGDRVYDVTALDEGCGTITKFEYYATCIRFPEGIFPNNDIMYEDDDLRFLISEEEGKKILESGLYKALREEEE